MLTSIEISGGELREYVASYRSVTFAHDGCRMRKKRGHVEFDLSWYGVKKVAVHVKRVGGNGKLTISGEEYDVGSKVSQTFDIDTGGDVELSRPQNSTGEVVLLGLTFSTDDASESNVKIDWKDIIKKCGKYSCLRLIKGRLYASTGGYIEGNIIKSIETDPPNAATIDSEKVYFNNSCEVTNIALSPAEAGLVPNELYVSRNPPTPINTPEPSVSSDATKRVVSGNASHKQKQYDHQLPNFDDHILYDSSSVRNFKQFSKDNFVRQIRSNNKVYLIVKQKGNTSASISTLKANTNYICIINGKKLNGNGRLYVGVSIDANFTGQAAEVMFGGSFTNRYVQLRTGGGAPNCPQKLHFNMPERYCSGEVLIQRIIIVEDLGIDNARAGLEGRRYVPASDVPHPGSPDALFGFNMDIRRDDGVYASSKKYAFYPSIHGAKALNNDIKGTIVSNNVSGVVWASRIKPLLKHVRIGNMKSEVGNDVLLVSHLGHLKPANRIWIEPFEFETTISESDARAIRGAEVVMSPSLSNVQSLQEKFDDKRIELAHRPLPWAQPQPEKFFHNRSFVLTFERDRRNLNKLLRVWSKELPVLVVVGARGKYPDFVIPLNEYYPYKKILYLMTGARFIVDLPEICDYHSSILDLANAMGKTMLSTNRYVLDKPNGLFVVRTEHKDNGRFVPSDDILKQGITKAMEVPVGDANDMTDHNTAFLNQMRSLFSL